MWLHMLFVAGIFALFVIHAWLALRKFPVHRHQRAVYWRHMRDMRQGDTTLWFVQVIIGIGMFFLAPVLNLPFNGPLGIEPRPAGIEPRPAGIEPILSAKNAQGKSFSQAEVFV